MKCDKVKPACGGCIKNGVPHLCEYIEPAWSGNSDGAKSGGTISKGNDKLAEEVEKLKAQKERTINEQRKEIEDLKRKLAVSQQLSPKGDNSGRDQHITILAKLNILNAKATMEVSNDVSYTVECTSLDKREKYFDIYSWLNIIKLDPHLTALWYKITNLQKIYHLYKMNMMNSSASGDLNSLGTTSWAKRGSNQINEVDFTHSLVPAGKAQIGHLKCPVVECDINFITERPSTPIPIKVEGSSAIKLQSHSEPKYEKFIQEYEEISYHSRILFKKIQNVWNSTLNLLRGNEMMNFDQLQYLLDFYFNNKVYNTESRKTLCFFKSEISNIVKKNGDSVSLNFEIGMSQSDKDKYFKLSIKGVYLCMLSLILEESLDIIRMEADLDITKGHLEGFQSLFPMELLYLGLGYKSNNVLLVTLQYLLHISEEKILDRKMSNSLSFVAACTTFLNRGVVNYMKQNIPLDCNMEFQSIFIQVMSCIFSKESHLKIWRNPQDILLTNAQSKQRVEDFRLCICYLWSDLIRLVNLVTLNTTPLVTKPEKIDNLIYEFYEKAVRNEVYNDHMNFIEHCSSTEAKELMTTFKKDYLISRIYYNLKSGVSNPNGLNRMLISDMIDECKSWKNDLSNQTKSRILETKCVLYGLYFHLSYILILQDEEDHGTNFAKVYPEFLNEFCDFIHLINSIIENENRNINLQYLLLLVTEALTRIIHFVVGLLLRFSNNNELNNTTVLLNLISIVDSKLVNDRDNKSKDLSLILNDIIVKIVNRTIDSLTNHHLINKKKILKLSKLWNFYLTFIKNSHKMDALDYANIHVNIPGFKIQTMSKCPVGPKLNLKKCPFDHGNTTPKDTKYARCPISHITTPMENEDIKPTLVDPGKCPVVHTSGPASPNQKKRKCPFDENTKSHDTPTNGNSTMNRNFQAHDNVDSNEETIPFTDSSATQIPVSTADNNLIRNISNPIGPIESEMMASQIPKSNYANTEVPDFGVNWQEFTDFDFEFLQNELMFKQMQQDNMATSLEDLFR